MQNDEKPGHSLKSKSKNQGAKKVIHIENCRKCEKIKLYTKLCTLSTKSRVEKSVDSSVKPERMFCEAFIKLITFTNRSKKLLTFES